MADFTFISVVQTGNPTRPYLAVQACYNLDALNADIQYNSSNNQPFAWKNSDVQLASKKIIDVMSGDWFTAEVYQLNGLLPIDDAIKAHGCDAAIAHGFIAPVQKLIKAHNAVAKAKVKLINL